MGAKSKKPKIRFAGFAEDWEQRKLGDVVIFLPHNTFSRADLSENGEILNIHYGDVLVKFGEVLDVSDEQIPFVSKTKKINNIDKLKLKNGDIIFADAAEDETVGKCTEVYAIFDKSVISGLHTIPCRPKINFAAAYLGYFFNSQCYHTQLLPLMQGIKVLSLSKTALLQTDIFYPSKQSEQSKIGTFFRHLDHLITLHQRKCGRLENIKKAMLERMFPKKGADVPEVRFAGFTGAWEQRKLGEIAVKVTEKNAASQYTETLTNSAEFGIIDQREFFDHDVARFDNLHGYYIVKQDYFVYNPRISNTAPVGPINRNKLGKTGVVSPLYTVFRTTQIENEFLGWFFKSDCWHSFMRFNGDSGARSDRFSIKNAIFFEMPIPLPYLIEQQKIGTFFRHLDHLISLHQRKLTLLQNIKKACLANMFA